MAVSRENKLPPSFLDFKSQRVLYESSHDGVSRIESDEQSLNRSASVSHASLAAQSVFLISKRQYDSKNTNFC